MNRRRSLLAGVAAATLLTCAAPAWGSNRLRIGLTPVILADQVAFLSRWGQYLSGRMGVEVEFVARESYQSILELLFSGQVDAAWVCGYPFVRHERALRLLCVPLYQGQPFYQAYLIRPNAPDPVVHGWADLRGRVLAYSDPLSNSGWLVAQLQLALAGVPVSSLRRGFFTHSHRNVVEAVAARLAHAGAVDGYVWETMRRQGMPAVVKTEVIWKSQPYGFPPLVVRNGTDGPLVEALRLALVQMDRDVQGQELLAALNLTGFARGQGEWFDSIRQLVQKVHDGGAEA